MDIKETSCIYNFFATIISAFVRGWDQSIVGRVCMCINKWIDNTYIIKKYNSKYVQRNSYETSFVLRLFRSLLIFIDTMCKNIGNCLHDSYTYKLAKNIYGCYEQSFLFKILHPIGGRAAIVYILMGYPFIDYFTRNYLSGTIASIWDESLFLLGILILLISSINKRRFNWKISKIDLSIFVYMMFAIFLLFINSPDMGIAIEGLRVDIEYIFWYFLVINLIQDKQEIKRAVKIFVWINAFVAFYGIYQYIVGVTIPKTWIVSDVESYIKTRVFSVVGSCNLLGSIMTLSIPIAISLFDDAKQLFKKIIYAIISLSMIVCLVFTFSRGAWIAFAFAAVLYAVLNNRKLLVIFVIGGILSIGVMPGIAKRITYMFSSDYAYRSANGGRIQRWTEAIQIGMKTPFKGHGLGRFGGSVARNHWITGTFFTDNYYVKSFTELGIIGLIIFLVMIFMIVKEGFGVVRLARGDPFFKNISVGMYCGLMAMVLHNLFENVFDRTVTTTYFWLIVGVLFSIKYFVKKSNDDKGVIVNDI